MNNIDISVFLACGALACAVSKGPAAAVSFVGSIGGYGLIIKTLAEDGTTLSKVVKVAAGTLAMLVSGFVAFQATQALLLASGSALPLNIAFHYYTISTAFIGGIAGLSGIFIKIMLIDKYSYFTKKNSLQNLPTKTLT